MWPPLPLVPMSPSANLPSALSAPDLLSPGVQRSLALMNHRHEGAEPTRRLPRPKVDAISPPRRFPAPPQGTRAAGCAFPMATTSMGAPLGCSASAGGLLAMDHSAGGSSPGLSQAASGARRRWQMLRQCLVVPLERKLELLHGQDFLEDCSRADLVRLARSLQVRVVGQMRQLVRQYELPSFFAVILRGQCDVNDINAGTIRVEEGACLGVEALGAHYGDFIPSLRTLITRTPCVLLVHTLPRELQRLAFQACTLRTLRTLRSASPRPLTSPQSMVVLSPRRLPLACSPPPAALPASELCCGTSLRRRPAITWPRRSRVGRACGSRWWTPRGSTSSCKGAARGEKGAAAPLPGSRPRQPAFCGSAGSARAGAGWRGAVAAGARLGPHPPDEVCARAGSGRRSKRT